MKSQMRRGSSNFNDTCKRTTIKSVRLQRSAPISRFSCGTVHRGCLSPKYCAIVYTCMRQFMIFWYLSHMRAPKAQTRLHIRTVSPER